MKCAVCLYVRNEERNIAEWIAYHKVIGFDAFLIYDNGSTDLTLTKLDRARAVADVRVIDWSAHTSEGAQNACYTDCCARYGGEFEWIAFIDSDEYLCSPSGELIQALIGRNRQSSGIALNWALFGSNGHQSFPGALLIEAFDRRADPDDTRFVTADAGRHVKMLIRPTQMIQYRNPHYFDLRGPIVDKDGRAMVWESPGIAATCNLDGWRINHYFTRSRAHWNAKMARGYRDIVRGDVEFQMYDRNDILDRSATILATPVLALLDAMDA